MIGHYAVYYLEVNLAIGREDRGARFGSVFWENSVIGRVRGPGWSP